MKPAESVLAGALEVMGRTLDDMHARYEAVTSLVQVRPGSAERLKLILSGALLGEGLYGAGPGTFVYRLPLWSKFTFLVTSVGSGQFIGRANFGRGDDGVEEFGARPEPAVWDFLESDLGDTFTQVREIDTWGHYSTYLAQDQISGQRYFLRFAWGLLQEMDRA